MTDLTSCKPDEIVTFGGQDRQLRAVVYEVSHASAERLPGATAFRGAGLKPATLDAGQLLKLAERKDFQDFIRQMDA
ncbi:hypothetical protein [Methylovirgula sp. 4M-Z18]|uniref:hypothetical protein n=1 Tax=Methylovirgula sp. 4M-Z18 TaxID=2293567 RepID=UPI0011C032F1|nr:hypothetical protein [Methylovirgula sp. 4M-Z18]